MSDMSVRLFRRTSKENLNKAIDALSLLRASYLDEASSEVWDHLYDAGCFLEARLAVYEFFDEPTVHPVVTVSVDAEALRVLQENAEMSGSDPAPLP